MADTAKTEVEELTKAAAVSTLKDLIVNKPLNLLAVGSVLIAGVLIAVFCWLVVSQVPVFVDSFRVNSSELAKAIKDVAAQHELAEAKRDLWLEKLETRREVSDAKRDAGLKELADAVRDQTRTVSGRTYSKKEAAKSAEAKSPPEN